MKQVFNVLIEIFRIIIGIAACFLIFLSLLTVFVALPQYENAKSGIYILLAIAFITIILCVLLLIKLFKNNLKKGKVKITKYPNKDSVKVPIVSPISNPYPLNTPADVLVDMKRYSSKNQLDDTLRIVEECRLIVKSTNNFETLISRLELGTQHSYVLKQYEQIGAYKNKPHANDYLDFFIGQKENILLLAINDTYNEMLEKSDKLKTEKGKTNRIISYFSELDEFANHFEFTKCEALILQLKEKHGLA